jgi:hypothetical protein
VARSARWQSIRIPLSIVLLAGAVVSLSGCSTTQDEAARLQLNSARIRVSQGHTTVRSAGDAVRVTRVSLITSHGASAFVVSVRNSRSTAVSDLPISVGVRPRHGRRVYVNGHSSQELSYFDAHLPLIGAGQTLTWVYTTDRSLAGHGRAFALVGNRPSPAARPSSSPPVIRTRVVSRSGTALSVSVHNTTTVPQYQLALYAVGYAARRLVAAGQLTVAHLGSHKTQVLKLPVLGRLDHVALSVAAPPTILH